MTESYETQSKWEEAESYQSLCRKTTEIIGSQRAWLGIFAQAVAIPEDHSVCPSISLGSLLDAHFIQGYKSLKGLPL